MSNLKTLKSLQTFKSNRKFLFSIKFFNITASLKGNIEYQFIARSRSSKIIIITNKISKKYLYQIVDFQ